MAYLGAGITRFNTADDLTVTGDAQIDTNTLVVDSTNNRVGILNASPATALDVTGTLTADDIVLSGGMSKTGDLTFDISGDINLDADGGDINFLDGGTLYGFMAKSNNDLLLGNGIQDGDVLIRGNDGGSNITALSFDISAAGAATFNSDVGVGMTPDSAVRLSVSGAVGSTNGSNSAPTHTFYGDPDTGMYRSGANALSFATGGSHRMTINSSGQVGIGDAPSQKLHVTGGGSSPQLRLTGSSGNIDFYSYTDGALYINNAAGTTLGLLANRDAYFNRNVGIGDSSPSSQYEKNLQIHTTSNTAGASLHITDGTSGSTNTDGFHLVLATGTPYLWNRENTSMIFGTNATERMRILAGGGLTFNGDTAAANALDDYEEGTWTPTVLGISAGATVTSATGYYTKIGNVCHVTFELHMTVTTISGSNIRFNLPVTGKSGLGQNVQGGRLMRSSALTTTAADQISFGIYNQSNLYLYNLGGGVIYSPSDFQTGLISGNFQYLTT